MGNSEITKKTLACPICGVEVSRYRAPHKCDPFLISIAPEYRPARKLRGPDGKPVRLVKPKSPQDAIMETVRLGRPRSDRRGQTFDDTMPWLELGISERTFYRRRAEYKELMASED